MIPLDHSELAIAARVSLPEMLRSLLAQNICVAQQIAGAGDPDHYTISVFFWSVESDHSLSHAVHHVGCCAGEENDLSLRVTKSSAAACKLPRNRWRKIELDEAPLKYPDAVGSL